MIATHYDVAGGQSGPSDNGSGVAGIRKKNSLIKKQRICLPTI
jgi:hypothetical protein